MMPRSTPESSPPSLDAAFLALLIEGFLPRVVAALTEAIADRQAVGPAPLLDRQGLARALAVSVSSVDRLVVGGMPYVRVGDVRRFVLDDVRAWLSREDPAPNLRHLEPRGAA